MKQLSIKAIIAGFAVDMIGSLVVAIGGGLLWASYEISQGVPAKNLSSPEYVHRALYENIPLMVVFMIAGLLSTVLGGAVAGWLAPASARLFNAAILGVIEVLLGLAMSMDMPLWYTLSGVLLTIPSTLFGALIVQLVKSDV